MATVSANELSLEKTLEELITEFNSLRGDVTNVTLETLISSASSSITFEGSTDDANETTLTVVDPTADRTITLPNVTGTVITDANADTPATTSTFGNLDHFLINDGGVLKKMALSTIASNLPALTPASANANALGSASLEWSDLFLGDSAVINFGNDQDTTLTHTDGAGLTLNSTNKLMFNDASQYIQGASATVLDIAATDEIELTATEVEINVTTLDVNGNLDVSGTIVGASTLSATTGTFSGILKTDDATEATSTTDGSLQTDGGLSVVKDIVAGDDIKLLSDASVIAFGADGEVTLTHVHNTGLRLEDSDKLIFGAGNDLTLHHDGSNSYISDAGTGSLITLASVFQVNNSGNSEPMIIATENAAVSLYYDNSKKIETNANGVSVTGDVLATDDLILDSDAAVIQFGDDQDVTLTHVADTGLLLNSTMQLQFNDASQFINAPSATVLDINATDEIELNATLVDVNANLDVSGTIVGASTLSATTGTFSGILKTDDATEATSTTDGSLQTDGGLSVVKDIVAGDDVKLLSDASVIHFGANSEVTLTHVHDVGLELKHTATADDKPIVLTLATGETDMAANDVMGKIQFQAPDEGTGTDAILVAAAIQARSEGDFSSSANATSLDFMTGASEAAATKMSITSGGNVSLPTDAAVLNFGVNSDVNLTHVHDTGLLLNSTMQLQFNDSSQYINAPSATVLDINATDEIELNATLVDINANVEISGNLSVAGTTTTVNTVTMNAQNAVIFEGATADAHETTLTITDPTADRTITLPNETGTVHTSGGDTTHSNIIIADGANIGSASDTNAIGISSGGVVSITATTASTNSTSGALTVAGGAGIAADLSVGDDLRLISDDSVIAFGADGDVTITHDPDDGLLLKSLATGDGSSVQLVLESGETDI